MIIISPFAKKLRNGSPHPKDYPYWKELIALIDEPIVQVGILGEIQLVDDFKTNLSLSELETLVHECRTWISVDSFFQHFCWDLGKKGIVLFGQSNPAIFGHEENINLYATRDGIPYFRQQQFWLWEQAEVIREAFVKPELVVSQLKLI